MHFELYIACSAVFVLEHILWRRLLLSIYSKVSGCAKCHRNARYGALQIDVKSGARSRCGSEFARLTAKERRTP